MIGDQADILARLKTTLPSWFPDSSPFLDGVLSGMAQSGSFVYGLYTYTKNQTRVKTATDDQLDLISADFFGAALPRKSNESDTNFRNRILIFLFRERATRNALNTVLTAVTGRTPKIFEPTRPADTGGYRVGGAGYSLAGGYGSLLFNNQIFVTAYRPAGAGIPYVAGYGSSPSGYSIPSRGEYADLSMTQGTVADADIYAAIENVRPVCTTIWTRLSN